AFRAAVPRGPRAHSARCPCTRATRAARPSRSGHPARAGRRTHSVIVRYPLPYAFARGNQLLLEDDGQQITLWHAAAPAPAALTEVIRKFGVRSLQQLDATALAP